jgi:AcrR family transcriptional regulator
MTTTVRPVKGNGVSRSETPFHQQPDRGVVAALTICDHRYGGVMDGGSDGRDRLVAAAWEVLARTGFAGFKVASVIRAAGASTTTFYRYFDSKDALFVDLLLDETRRGSARIQRLVSGATGATEAVRAWVAATMSAAARPELRARARLFASLGDQVQDHPQAIAETRQMLVAPLLRAIEAGSATGELQSADPASDATCIHRMCRSALTDLLNGISDEDTAQVIARVQDFAIRALT